jgi:hypothetical protein
MEARMRTPAPATAIAVALSRAVLVLACLSALAACQDKHEPTKPKVATAAASVPAGPA